jgi:hypothetical protein
MYVIVCWSAVTKCTTTTYWRAKRVGFSENACCTKNKKINVQLAIPKCCHPKVPRFSPCKKCEAFPVDLDWPHTLKGLFLVWFEYTVPSSLVPMNRTTYAQFDWYHQFLTIISSTVQPCSLCPVVAELLVSGNCVPFIWYLAFLRVLIVAENEEILWFDSEVAGSDLIIFVLHLQGFDLRSIVHVNVGSTVKLSHKRMFSSFCIDSMQYTMQTICLSIQNISVLEKHHRTIHIQFQYRINSLTLAPYTIILSTLLIKIILNSLSVTYVIVFLLVPICKLSIRTKIAHFISVPSAGWFSLQYRSNTAVLMASCCLLLGQATCLPPDGGRLFTMLHSWLIS